MAEAFLQVLIENLSSLIQREIGLIMGVDKEMKKLSSTLTTIQTVLEDAEDKQLQSKPIQNWLSKLNDLAYEVDDILDECATEVSKLERKKGSVFNLKKILFSHKIGRRMKEMAEKLDAVAAERHNFHLREIVMPQSSEVDARRETVSVLNEPDHIYGRDEDKKKIVDMLVNQVTDCQQLSVLPIIGIGGLGKTTLAQLVFNDQRVRQHFHPKLWVCVSDNFDLKILLKKMIEPATESASNLEHLEALQHRLSGVLNQNRYLLILDDVWNEDQESWAKLKSILVCGSKGASVVVTTRQENVANIMGTLPAHCLTGLSEEHCWLLFRLRAFGQEREEHPNLETIGRQIVKKCAGVPLAAKALGGLLRFKRKEKEWIHVKESEIWNFPEEDTLILPALRLSYHHLPLVLRRCFVYCAVFPKDSIIEKQNLIFHWMAHGCISSNGIQEVEDVGDQIWNELVLRSFFQEVEVDTIEGRTTFKMHDLVHDLAQSLMENKIPGAQTKSSSVSASNSKIREVHFSRHSETSHSGITKQVSALTTLMNYNRLRILKLTRTREEKLPCAIGKLKHLRYLNLEFSRICTLPNTFCGLWNLQILILNHCSHLTSLPKHITSMTNLRHIFLEGCPSLSHVPSGIGELISLKTLSLFIVDHKKGNRLDELELLNLGGRLRIEHLERTQDHMNAKRANLVKKTNLRDLVLRWEGHGTSEFAKKMDEKVLEALEPHPNLETLKIDGFKGSYFPPWMTKMENVTEIIIENCPNCSRLPLLGDLPRLKSLKLKNLDALEDIVEDEIRGQNSVRAKFASLEILKLCSLPNLKGLLKGEEVGEMFPNLRRLYISQCQLLILPPLSNARGLKSLTELEIRESKIASFPEGWLPQLTALEELDIYKCPELVELPQEQVPSLQSLRLGDLPQLTSLPEWLGNLTSLTRLEIVDCPRVPSLPSSIQGWTNLRYFRIWDCPQLERRCEKGKGEDWHKMAHISQASMESSRVAECWKFPHISDSSQLKTLKLPDPLTPSKVVQLLYTNYGEAVLALASNAIHKLWKWQRNDRNPSGKSSASSVPRLWQPTKGALMSNDQNDAKPAEDSVACLDLSNNDGYIISASGGKVSLFNMKTFKVMTTFMPPPPAATYLVFHPHDNNIIAIGMEDSTILIYDASFDEVKTKLKGHQKRISGLAFSQSLNILVSSGADAQLCMWNIDGWEKKKSQSIQAPPGHPTPLVVETRVQFHNNQSHLLIVHESQIAIYDAQLECLRSWYPRDSLSSAISSAISSCDGLLIFAGFCDGGVAIFDSDSLSLRCRIASSAYISSSIPSNGNAFPVVIAAHPTDPNQFALGMSNGAVHVIEPLKITGLYLQYLQVQSAIRNPI